jgi:hypothetical protein
MHLKAIRSFDKAISTDRNDTITNRQESNALQRTAD